VEAVLRVPRGGGEDGGAALVPVLTTAILFSTMDRCVGGFEIPAIIMLTLTRLLHGHHHAHARCLRPRLRLAPSDPHAGAHMAAKHSRSLLRPPMRNCSKTLLLPFPNYCPC
jgi:hypothetical protein